MNFLKIKINNIIIFFLSELLVVAVAELFSSRPRLPLNLYPKAYAVGFPLKIVSGWEIIADILILATIAFIIGRKSQNKNYIWIRVITSLILILSVCWFYFLY